MTKEAKDTVCLSVMVAALLYHDVTVSEIFAIVFALMFLKEWE